MPTLSEQIAAPAKRSAIIDDACRVLDTEVDSKSGLSGIAIKGAYKLVQGVKPGFIREVVDALLDEFLQAIEPMYQEALSKGERPSTYLETHSARTADALLAVTDKRAARAKHPMLKKTYEKLRPSAHKHVEGAVPRVAGLLERHAAAS